MIYFPFELAKIYEQERLEEAEHCRQLKEIWRDEAHLFAKIAKFSVCFGRRLKKQVKQTVAVLTKMEMKFEGWFKGRMTH